MSTLQSWLYEIYKNYNIVPFHNFKHCFMVAQMVLQLFPLNQYEFLIAKILFIDVRLNLAYRTQELCRRYRHSNTYNIRHLPRP